MNRKCTLQMLGFALALGSCIGNSNTATINETDSTEITSGDSVVLSTNGHIKVVPEKPSYSLNSLKNVVVPANFNGSDIDWDKHTLSMTVYYEDIYDAKAVNKMRAGDTIVFDDRTIVVEKIEWQDSLMIINDGPTGKTCYTREEVLKEKRRQDSIRANGGQIIYGALLERKSKGIYRSVADPTPHSIYHKMGKVTLPLSKDFVFICSKVDPNEPYDTIRVDQQQYIENMRDRTFIPIDTHVKIENGVITNITRYWIP